MKRLSTQIVDANEAVAEIAYQLSEVIAIYPITPASPMGEFADLWSTMGRENHWGTVPAVVEMQSEGGAAGLLHGAIQTGSLGTSFTASQGLLLMIPAMYKIAGELTPTVLHVAARSIATHALSIFGDHSDVMAARMTGWAMLCSNSVQEAQDLALVAHSATLETRIPFLHFFDGFRTSHELATIESLDRSVIEELITEERIFEHRQRSLSPDHPVIRGTAQNPDVFFQGRERANARYDRVAEAVQNAMDTVGRLTGRSYKIFEYHGAADAENVIVLMGSGADVAHETVDYLNQQGAGVGVLKVRLFRPFSATAFAAALPPTVRRVAVLDRTKEPGSVGEPLYLECVTALAEAGRGDIRVVGGRYGLGSKEFTPTMVRAVFHNLEQEVPRNHFCIGIEDDLSHTSLSIHEALDTEPEETYRAVFYGLGSDGTVGANKESAKLIGRLTGLQAQGYFVYDSRKAGAVTISHLRFGRGKIRSSYLIQKADFVACHQWHLLETLSVLDLLSEGGTFLLNSPYPPERVWVNLPVQIRERLLECRARFFVIDANAVARAHHLGGRINTVMQTCFLAITDLVPLDQALDAVRPSIRKAYHRKGSVIVERNLAAVDAALSNLHEVPLPQEVGPERALRPRLANEAPAFVHEVIGSIIAGQGDQLPLSALPEDGTYPTGTTQWEKRCLAAEIPVWDADLCIQCGRCVIACPHAVVRSKVCPPDALADAPQGFVHRPARLPAWKGMEYTLQISAEDCTGCGICVDVCPAKSRSAAGVKALAMVRRNEDLSQAADHWKYFQELPTIDPSLAPPVNVRTQQVQQPYFEFSSACAGCGETPYVKLASQLFGDRMVVANATGCSSIYGGNLPTTPWTSDLMGRGPAWSNSLFENNAEFGMGFRVSIDRQQQVAIALLEELAPHIGDSLVDEIRSNPQRDTTEIARAREAIVDLRLKLVGMDDVRARRLELVAENLIRRSVWIIGGDGWANDIGFGGLDHVLASGRDVNILVLDTEVYSNTGGQMSKGTPLAATAKFAAAGKRSPKKDLGLFAMGYDGVYVASVAMGARDEQTLKAFVEADAHHGPSLVIAYSHCIAHGIEMRTAMQNQKAAVDCGQWILYRRQGAGASQHGPALSLDSGAPRTSVEQYFRMENRFLLSGMQRAEESLQLIELANENIRRRWKLYSQLAAGSAATGDKDSTIQSNAN